VNDSLTVLAILAVWIVVRQFVLPRLGVPT
jgi:hypothetical protein